MALKLKPLPTRPKKPTKKTEANMRKYINDMHVWQDKCKQVEKDNAELKRLEKETDRLSGLSGFVGSSTRRTGFRTTTTQAYTRNAAAKKAAKKGAKLRLTKGKAKRRAA
jgi:hypothetical protein